MSEELAVNNRTLRIMMDDLLAYMESLTFLECELDLTPPEERGDIDRQITEVKTKIEGLNQEVAGKTDAIAAMLRRIDQEQEFIHEERERLKAKEQACERTGRQLREYVMAVMRQQDMMRLKTQLNTLFLRSTEAVEITDAGALEPPYLMAEAKMPYSLWLAIMRAVQEFAPRPVASDAALVRVKTEASLSAIKKAIKAGGTVQGADLLFRKHLVCR